MNLKGYVLVEIVKNNRNYYFNLPIGAPYAEVYEVINELGEGMQSFEKQALEQQEKNKAEVSEKVKEEECQKTQPN